MKRSDLKGKRVTVFGLGLNEGGVGTVGFLERSLVGEIVVTDVKKREELATSLRQLEKYKNIRYVLGAHRPEDFSNTDLVVKNPAIPWTNEYIRVAEAAHVPVEMDSSLFFSCCKNPIIGVTGTRGKTTTAGMIAHIFETAKKSVARVGISQTPVLGVLEKIRSEDTVVFELSSWRLSALGRKRMSPTCAVVTNVYPDHLNYYKGMEEYIRDKRYIFQYQKKNDIAIFNADNDVTMGMAKSAPGRVFLFSAGEFSGEGAFFRGDEAWCRVDGKEEKLFGKDDLAVPGEHNHMNALSAALVAFLRGVPVSVIRKALSTFPGTPHRLEFVAEKRGISFYNDTAATSPDGAVAALKAFDKPIILLAGGADKNLSFGEFAGEIISRTKAVVFFRGNGTESLLREIRKRLPENERDRSFETVSSMEKAIEHAMSIAIPGDIVLLSPGAASFGIFKNEFDRGERFYDVVASLPV